MSHECSRCGKKFKYPYLLKNHENAKRPCKPLKICDDLVSGVLPKHCEELPKHCEKLPNRCESGDIRKKFECEFCLKEFSHRSGLSRHKTELRCKRMPQEVINNVMRQCKNCTVNNIKQQIINININPFGKEDISHITSEVIKQLVNEPIECVANMIEAVHDIPENKNFYCPSASRNILCILDDDNKIKYKNFNQTLDDMILVNKARFENLIIDLEELEERFKNRIYDQFDKNMSFDKENFIKAKNYVIKSSKENKKLIEEFSKKMEELRDIKIKHKVIGDIEIINEMEEETEKE